MQGFKQRDFGNDVERNIVSRTPKGVNGNGQAPNCLRASRGPTEIARMTTPRLAESVAGRLFELSWNSSDKGTEVFLGQVLPRIIVSGSPMAALNDVREGLFRLAEIPDAAGQHARFRRIDNAIEGKSRARHAAGPSGSHR